MNNIIRTVGICFGLVFPNILTQIIRKCKGLQTASAHTFIMNLIQNISFGCTISYIKGGRSNVQLLGFAGMLYAWYWFIVIIYAIAQCCCQTRGLFSAISRLCENLEESTSFIDTVNFNRTLPPRIYAGAYAAHQESREVWEEYEKHKYEVYRTEGAFEVFDHWETEYRYRTTHYSNWRRVDCGGGYFNGCPGYTNSRYEKTTEYKTVETWREEIEYKYKSWQDITKDFGIDYCVIFDMGFHESYAADEQTVQTIQRFRNQLYSKGMQHDTDVTSYERYVVPGRIARAVCSLDDQEYQRIKTIYGSPLGFILWFICFLAGYTTVYEAFARFIKGTASINIMKYISSKNNARAEYYKRDFDIKPLYVTINNDPNAKTEEDYRKAKPKKKETAEEDELEDVDQQTPEPTNDIENVPQDQTANPYSQPPNLCEEVVTVKATEQEQPIQVQQPEVITNSVGESIHAQAQNEEKDESTESSKKQETQITNQDDEQSSDI